MIRLLKLFGAVAIALLVAFLSWYAVGFVAGIAWYAFRRRPWQARA